MNPVWLIIDANNLAFRSFATTGGLSHRGNPTGTTYGFLKQVKRLRELFLTDQLVFCFDDTAKVNRRKELSPTYKVRRSCLDEDRARAFDDYRTELRSLRDDVLPGLGFRNVFWQEGYEADDVIAGVNETLDTEAVIVSSDHDLWQLLGPMTYVWLPHRNEEYRADDLWNDYGVSPGDWPRVLALAGCPGDGVRGIKGVGLKTAARYVANTLGLNKAHRTIEEHEREYLDRNLPLVELPFAGVKSFRLRNDEPDRAVARATLKSLGFTSLLETW